MQRILVLEDLGVGIQVIQEFKNTRIKKLG